MHTAPLNNQDYAQACHTPPVPFREEALVTHEACRVTAALHVMRVSDMLRAGCSGACWKRAGAARCCNRSGVARVRCTCCTSDASYAATAEVFAAWTYASIARTVHGHFHTQRESAQVVCCGL